MLKILYDDAAFNQPFGGVTKYFVELIKNLPRDCCAELCQRTTQNICLQKEPFAIPKATHTQWNFWPWLRIRGKWMVYRFLAQTLRLIPSCEYENRRLFVEKLKRGDFDVLHITDPHKYTFEWEYVVGKKPIVMTVHDLIPDMHSSAGRIRRNRARALRLVDHVIAVSENTKRDIVKLYGTSPEKITVVYHGAVVGGAKDQARDGKFSNFQPYLLYVGGRRGYKNFSFFAGVAARMLNGRRDLHLICTGGELSSEELRTFADAGVSDRVYSMYVDDTDLPLLYAQALMFVYPSKYEGFGIPVLDAFNAGCPVLLARASCFPEVGGNAALYFDPDDSEELYRTMSKLIDDGSIRERLVQAGAERVKNFTWSRCAEETANVYRSVVK